MSHRQNVHKIHMWHLFHDPKGNESEGWIWTLLDLLVDLPGILIRRLFTKLRPKRHAFRQALPTSSEKTNLTITGSIPARHTEWLVHPKYHQGASNHSGRDQHKGVRSRF
jgi:hypothetical protein